MENTPLIKMEGMGGASEEATVNEELKKENENLKKKNEKLKSAVEKLAPPASVGTAAVMGAAVGAVCAGPGHRAFGAVVGAGLEATARATRNALKRSAMDDTDASPAPRAKRAKGPTESATNAAATAVVGATVGAVVAGPLGAIVGAGVASESRGLAALVAAPFHAVSDFFDSVLPQ